MTVEKWSAAAITSLATTELNSLASAAGALGVEYDNATNDYPFGICDSLFCPSSSCVVDVCIDWRGGFGEELS